MAESSASGETSTPRLEGVYMNIKHEHRATGDSGPFLCSADKRTACKAVFRGDAFDFRGGVVGAQCDTWRRSVRPSEPREKGFLEQSDGD